MTKINDENTIESSVKSDNFSELTKKIGKGYRGWIRDGKWKYRKEDFKFEVKQRIE